MVCICHLPCCHVADICKIIMVNYAGDWQVGNEGTIHKLQIAHAHIKQMGRVEGLGKFQPNIPVSI